MADCQFSSFLPFDTDNPEFTRGFEAGIIWRRLTEGEELDDFLIHAENAEMVIRMAEHLGLHFSAEDVGDEWMTVVMRRG